ncbi:MAG TPA: glycosyltransferase family 4 protein [Bacteroidia bacterium]|nr:glycosyltransferase family 4 protein [Bacteroidia bacterium]
MKILQLCNKLPYPEKDGGAIAINTLTHSLLDAGCQVKMLAMNTKKHFTDIDSIPEKFRKDTGLETVLMDTTVKARKALLALLRGKSYNISRFYSADFRHKLESILKAEQYDVIQLEGLYLTPYIRSIRKITKAPIILRAHNVEWKIWQMLSQEEKKPLKKTYLLSLSKMLKAYETKAINKCDGLTVFTQTDKKQFIEMGCTVPIEVFPFGIALTNYIPALAAKTPTLFYIGSLDWMPNLHGLEWFLKHVWNKVHLAYPNAEFHVAGRSMPKTLKKEDYPGVLFHGEIEDAYAFMKEHGVQLVPLFAGSGIRIKIIEGMALQKAIITTSVGIEGIDCVHGQDAIVANTSGEFFEAIKSFLDDANYSQQIASNARKYIETAHNISNITSNLLVFYKQLIPEKAVVS